MKAKRKISILLASVAVIGCMAVPAMAGGTRYSINVSGRYNGSMLEYRANAMVYADSKGCTAYVGCSNCNNCKGTYYNKNHRGTAYSYWGSTNGAGGSVSGWCNIY